MTIKKKLVFLLYCLFFPSIKLCVFIYKLSFGIKKYFDANHDILTVTPPNVLSQPHIIPQTNTQSPTTTETYPNLSRKREEDSQFSPKRQSNQLESHPESSQGINIKKFKDRMVIKSTTLTSQDSNVVTDRSMRKKFVMLKERKIRNQVLLQRGMITNLVYQTELEEIEKRISRLVQEEKKEEERMKKEEISQSSVTVPKIDDSEEKNGRGDGKEGQLQSPGEKKEARKKKKREEEDDKKQPPRQNAKISLTRWGTEDETSAQKKADKDVAAILQRVQEGRTRRGGKPSGTLITAEGVVKEAFFPSW